MSSPRVTVAVLQRESFGHTERSLKSLYATAGAPFELIYVDAGSPPAVQRLIEAESRSRGFTVRRFDHFLTPNVTRNIALAEVTSEFVAFVDNDVIFRDGWLAKLLTCADETGADLVGPLIFMNNPPFRMIHFAGGEAHIEETASGRRFYETHRYGGLTLETVPDRLVREPSEMLELHCLLVRRSLFDRIGPFDEGLTSISEHLDLNMLARENGATLMFEPAAMVSHLVPKLFPLDLQSLPFFYERWSDRSNRASIDYFRAKWKLRPDDFFTEESYYWCGDRRWIIFRYLNPQFFRRGMRKLRRIAKRLLRK